MIAEGAAKKSNKKVLNIVERPAPIKTKGIVLIMDTL